MLTWLLVIVLWGDGKAIETVEVPSLEVCEKAKNNLRERHRALGMGPFDGTFCLNVETGEVR